MPLIMELENEDDKYIDNTGLLKMTLLWLTQKICNCIYAGLRSTDGAAEADDLANGCGNWC